jgi:undecaprenyl-diphosphatase
MPLWQVILLGLIEGLTEFIPVSSTGHILLAGHFLSFCSPGKSFEILIQLGAVLAVLSVYFGRLVHMAFAFPNDPGTRRFILGILVAFLPAALVGAVFSSAIDRMLETPLLVCMTLIVGGVILLAVDRMNLRVHSTDVRQIPPLLALKIGLCQCLAMIPGVSRSGSTIVGAMLLGTDKRTAAEFSFYLAMPTMAGAFTFKLLKHWNELSNDHLASIAAGFVVALLAGVFVVKYLLDYVSRNGFALFGWWRIIVGGMALGALLVLGTASGCPTAV